jgi:DNA sulfur modification protein DndB
MSVLYLPALRGQLGTWDYYACLMRLGDAARLVTYADQIHENKSLSDMIQRALDDSKRSKEIERYLIKTKDRFFNSLVVGVYGGDPQWHPFEVKALNAAHAKLPMDEDTIGYLELSGQEDLFALDGQHRLAGIKLAIHSEPALKDERISVLFVSHRKDTVGLKRTRSLFVAINKRAVPVNKRDIIALDEVDLAAIITRQLVDEHRWFSRGQIDVNRFTAAVPANSEAIMTIASLYDVVRGAIRGIMSPQDIEKLREADRIRLSDAEIAKYKKLFLEYFQAVVGLDPQLGTALAAKVPGPLIPPGRSQQNPRLLFRPIGYTIVTDALTRVRKEKTLKDTLRRAKSIPIIMSAAPFKDVIYDPLRDRMMTTNAKLAARVLAYMLGATADARLKDAWAKHVGRPGAKLPNSLIK